MTGHTDGFGIALVEGHLAHAIERGFTLLAFLGGVFLDGRAEHRAAVRARGRSVHDARHRLADLARARRRAARARPGQPRAPHHAALFGGFVGGGALAMFGFGWSPVVAAAPSVRA